MPFEVTIPEGEQDKDLTAKFRAEFPGILNWMLEGAVAYFEEGLVAPAKIKTANAKYRDEMNILGDWIAECCVERPGAITPVKNLYASYRNWAKDSGHYPWAKKRFGMRLKKLYQDDHTRSGTVYLGLTLKVKSTGDARRRGFDFMNETYYGANATGDGCDK